MLIRRAEPADAVAVARIHVRSWRASYVDILSADALSRVDEASRATLWSRRLTDSDGRTLLVAEAAPGGVVGFLYLGPSPDLDADSAGVGQVLVVHVDPAVTGHGVGGSLLEHAVAAFRTAGFAAATLWVVSSNVRARRFYERAGWSPDGVERREPLAVEGESGANVTVVRYRIDV